MICNQKRNTDSGLIEVTRDVVDMAGRIVSIPESVEKVFMDWGQGKVQLMALNAFDKVVAVDTGINADNFDWARTFIKGMQNVNIDQSPYTNIEALLKYEPDVVFSIENPRKAEEYELMGINVVVLKFSDFDSYLQAINIMGQVLGLEYEKKARDIKDFYDEILNMIEERLTTVDNSDKKSIYYIAGSTDGSNPLDTMTNIIFETSFIEKAGGILVTNELETPNGYITITKEKLLELEPELILIGSQYRHSTEQLIYNDDVFKELTSIQNNQVFRIPQGIFGWSKMGPEYGLNIIWAAKLFHPNLFEDIDMVQITQNFYKKFFDTDVTSDYVLMILSGKIPPNGE